MQHPSTLDAAIALLQHPDQLEALLRAQLVLISCTSGAPAVRAIELLLDLPPAKIDEDLSTISTEDLLKVERRAIEFIRLAASEEGIRKNGA
jgi:hypothetical protein